MTLKMKLVVEQLGGSGNREATKLNMKSPQKFLQTFVYFISKINIILHLRKSKQKKTPRNNVCQSYLCLQQIKMSCEKFCRKNHEYIYLNIFCC